ncbi:MAG TPA: pyruvoyl-dependent arginine decarboxylase, partial [Candidatus Saccharicenans sp.]|nr:pyruvoyl-dependent arginine decarboxylase [Candidatus Saccharicenans sp.]HUM79703.1 pyruvoyl-dependent arginine decarboxylase [Candidatus Saccharicenans sp.]
MEVILPRQVFLTRGQGQHREKLVSFELALRAAGISPFNLVRVSSIFPPHCQVISRASGLKKLQAGQIV